jgi:hypothetical protein
MEVYSKVSPTSPREALKRHAAWRGSVPLTCASCRPLSLRLGLCRLAWLY